MTDSTHQIPPFRFGISLTEVHYLIVFRGLEEGPCNVQELTEQFRLILDPFNKCPKRAQIYAVIKNMQAYEWIENMEGKKRKYSLRITPKGSQQLKLLEDIYFDITNKIHRKIKSCIDITNGTPSQPVILTNDEMKLFNRIINVKLAIHYLILDHLCTHDQVTGLGFMSMIKRVYKWSFNESYFYRMTRTMEAEPFKYIVGKWDHERVRKACYYSITPAGREIVHYERDQFLMNLEENEKYIGGVLKLLRR